MPKIFQLKRNTTLLLVFFGVLIPIIIPTPVQGDYVASDLGDVISVYIFMNFQKPGGEKTFWIEKKSMDIYMGATPIPASINQSIAEEYPNRHDIQLETVIGPVRTRLIGLRIGEEDEFTIPAYEVGITDSDDPLHNADLFYQVRLIEILYDSQVKTIPELELTDPIVLITGSIILGILIGLLYYKIPQKVLAGIIVMRTDKCSVCDSASDVVCGNIKCRSIICRNCFQEHNGCPHCGGVSIQTKK